ncbi:lipopolysaccharide kinase InaA family protein [Sorangium sp. So ce1078]|uniref:lipopolysaccharide kinase InaA family protein n=1 Tax=Sorangium sp. So ce1078 TaxID=3133329 RepID=UPI003F626E76
MRRARRVGDGLPVVLKALTSLDVVLRDSALDLPTTSRIGTRVAGTLAALHRAGVIHEDIKPHNVLVRLDPHRRS